MSDGLKQHINDNREEYELYPFDIDQGWTDIFGKIVQKPKSKMKRLWYSIAASVVILLAASMVIRLSTTPASLFPAEFQEARFYYQDMIDAKLNMVKNQTDDPQLLQDIDALDMAFAELSEDLEENVHNDEVITAMIGNYRLKLKILERILENLEEDSHEENIGI